MASPSDKCQPATATADMELKNYLVDKVLPGLVADGALGRDATLVGHDITPIGGYGEDHWMSTTFRVAVDVQDPKLKTKRTERLVAKFALMSDTVWSDPHVVARNEEHMYNQVVPFFQELWDKSGAADDKEPLGLFPKCYMGTTGATPLLVLEDLTAKGYRLAASQCALDGAHVFLALQRLGKLHALSYSAKIRRRNDFISLAQTLANAEYSEAKRAFQSGVLARVGARGTQRLAARAGSGVDAATVEHLRRRLHSDRDSSPLYETMVAARSAEEPLAVIAHGDFCRNNIMFKYDEATGRPVDVVFFDLQTAKYCSAAVDLSFFLFLNTTRAQRAAHWDDFFLAYYDGLTTAMRRLLSNGSNPAVTPTMDMPSLSSLRADFARHALYGYTICSFFLPMMQPGNENQAPNHEDYAFVADMEDQYEGGCRVGEMMVAVGGEAGDDTAADLLAEFVERGLVGL